MARGTLFKVPPFAVLDTNVLLLLLVGETDPKLIPRIARLSHYSIPAYRKLKRSLAMTRGLLVTPHVFSELSNLPFQDIKGPLRERFVAIMRLVLGRFEERSVEMETILKHPLLEKIGVTDVSLAEAGRRRDTVIVTDDFRAAGMLERQGCRVFNTNWMLGQMYLGEP
ncbi:MAG: hypothetical protein ACLFV7_03835 [Phycisphaerae bacterium]